MDGSSVFGVVVFRCGDADACSQSDSEAGEEARKQTDCGLLAVTV